MALSDRGPERLGTKSLCEFNCQWAGQDTPLLRSLSNLQGTARIETFGVECRLIDEPRRLLINFAPHLGNSIARCHSRMEAGQHLSQRFEARPLIRPLCSVMTCLIVSELRRCSGRECRDYVRIP